MTFTASITEAGQLALPHNRTELPYTVVGSATGTPLAGGGPPAAATLIIEQLR